MRVKDVLMKAVFPITLLVVWSWLAYNFCISIEQEEWWKIWMVIGIPYGVRRMFIWILPKNFDIGGTVGVWVLNIIIGCLIGEMMVVWYIFRAVYIMVKYFVNLL